MPTVPRYDSQQVGPSGGALPLFSGVQPPAPMPNAARQTQELGTAMQRAGDAGERIALDMKRQADQLRVDDALNQVKNAALRLTYDKDAGFQRLKGAAALEKEDGGYFDLPGTFAGQLQQHVDSAAARLMNDEQRQAFELRANDILTSFHGQAMQHQGEEIKAHGLSISEGVQATAVREIGLAWRNPETVGAAVERIRAETYRQAKLLGKSAEWQEAQARKTTSHAHKTALFAALEQNDAAYADRYLDKHSDQMDAADILAVRGYITKEMDAQLGGAAAGDAIARVVPRFQASDATRAFNIALGTESGHRQFGADGKPLTSPKGAIGIAQVMPDTAPEAAKLAGLPWDEHRYRTDEQYNKALGFAYFQKQLQDNSGDIAKAFAAYNAGPGRLREAIKKADRSVQLAKGDPGLKAHTWLDFMPQETKAYVAKNLAAYEAGQGQERAPTFAEVDEALRSDPRLAGHPARYKAAREEASRRFDEQVKAVKQREEEAVASAMRGILENGGRYHDLPVALRAALPPKEVDGLISYAQKIAKGDDTTSPWLYNKLTSNPDALARMSDDAFFALRRELSEADFKHFSNLRAKAAGQEAGTGGAGDLNTQAIKQAVDARLRVLGLDPTPKDDSKDAARVGAQRQFIDQYFYAAQREAGKKFTDAEVAAHVDALFAQNATLRGWFSTSSGPLLAMKASDIDAAMRERLRSSFRRQGVDDPTDAQLLGAYWTLKTTRK